MDALDSTRRATVPLGVLALVVVFGGILATRLPRGPAFSSPPAQPVLAGLGSRPTSHDDESAPGPVLSSALFRDIARDRNPVVVSIMTRSHVTAGDSEEGSGDDFLRRFFGLPEEPQSQVQRGLGSGFIVSANGEILTNNHVVAGADEIRVGLFENESKTYIATVVGRDPLTDSALIRLQDGPVDLPVAPLGDSDSLEPGDWVMAIGNPFQLGHTVTVGVISYRGRPFAVSEGRFQDMLQTDASINPGNSGGPLIDMRGEVVGINAAIYAGEGRGNIGIGFAVPINAVKALLPQLRQGKVMRSHLGVRLQTAALTDEEARSLKLPRPGGSIVGMVEPDSPAERAGLRAGDVIVEIDGKAVKTGADLTALVASTRPGTRIRLTYYRHGSRETTVATLDELKLEGETHAERVAASSGFGLSLDDLTADLARQLRLPAGTTGALVREVAPFSPGSDSGIQPGDVIVEVNHSATRSAREASAALRGVRTGGLAFLLIARQGNQEFVEVRKS